MASAAKKKSVTPGAKSPGDLVLDRTRGRVVTTPPRFPRDSLPFRLWLGTPYGRLWRLDRYFKAVKARCPNQTFKKDAVAAIEAIAKTLKGLRSGGDRDWLHIEITSLEKLEMYLRPLVKKSLDASKDREGKKEKAVLDAYAKYKDGPARGVIKAVARDANCSPQTASRVLAKVDLREKRSRRNTI
ncbi:MAG TPA: hypothetical protein VJT81_00460 [Burkholderiales bacterium]|nr:hypothetical protein [Burkholderiales bacterium]